MVKMGNTAIVPAGKELSNFSKIETELNIEKVMIIAPKKYLEEAKTFSSELSNKNLQVKIINLEPSYWDNFFRIARDLADLHKESEGDSSDMIMLIDTGDAELKAIATSAAFINGMKAVTIRNDSVELLPLFRFNYYSSITVKKMEILKVLEGDKTCCSSLEDLSKRTKMSLPLISYHINGNLKSEGLKKMGLVDAKEVKGKIVINLSIQGRMLMNGYIDEEIETSGKKK